MKTILSGSGIESDIKQKQVEALSIDESMKPETHLFSWCVVHIYIMVKSVTLRTSDIQGVANTFYDMKDNLENLIFQNWNKNSEIEEFRYSVFLQ